MNNVNAPSETRDDTVGAWIHRKRRDLSTL